MLRIGSALLLVGLWTAPLTADEPVDVDAAVDLDLQIETDAVVGDEVGVDFDKTLEFTADAEICLELVDPIPEDLTILTFSSEPVDGEVTGEEHTDHVCEFVDDQCIDADCIWMRTRTLEDDGVYEGDEVLMFMSGVADNDMSIQTFGGPSLPAAAIEHAQGVPFDASLRIVHATAVHEVTGLGLETAAVATVQAQTNEPTLVDRIFHQSNEPAPVTDADRDYASQLASIDELRDRALTTGDATLLQRADRMEADLKANTRTGFSLFGN
jgi:hypothetical protein